MHPQSNTFALALKLLKARDRFESEVRGTLTAASSPTSEIDEAISALRDLGFLNDERLAVRTAERLSQEKLWPTERIRTHLESLGAPTEAALANLPDDLDTARRLVKKRRKTGAALARSLSSAGFDAEIVRAIVENE
jgi:SOS response regulatory protein OraA/RecX